MRRTFVVIALILSVLLGACTPRVQTPKPTVRPSATTVPTLTVGPTKTPVPSKTPTVYRSPTPTSTFTTDQIIATSQAIYEMVAATEMIDLDPEVVPTQFFINCSSFESLVTSLSPDGNWFAASCGSWNNSQKMVVQDSKGKKWELEFDDLLAEIDRQEEDGWGYPKHWSSDGQFLYFSTVMFFEAYGVNQCFSNGSNSGVFRLNLDSGNVETIIGLKDTYHYFLASFSPNDRFIATDINGVTLYDLSSGETRPINAYPGMSFAWSGDGSELAYSVATCSGEKMEADTSSIFVYDTETGATKKVITVDGAVLYARDWLDDEHLRFDSIKIVDFNDVSTYFLYDITEDEYVPYINTPTPTP